MPRKQVLIAGASGLVGYAAMRHFGADPDCEVIALSRRAPDGTHGARFLPLDLTDAAACEQLASRAHRKAGDGSTDTTSCQNSFSV
jgi:NAD(P)-dependent dehydrogenase (short-subunit alcohol dehydrogenase family)